MWRKSLFIALILVGILGAAVIPAAAQSGIVWNAEYYNNAILQGPPTVARQDSAVSFNWGSGSPASGVNADNFSARWGTDPFFQAGTYRFWVLGDDKIRVYVDFGFQAIIDTFANPAVGQIVSADVTLTQGVHHIQVDYQEAAGDAYVYVTWANLATNPTGPNFPPIGNNPLPISSGPWTAQYYANATLSGTPTLIQTETSPSRDWGSGSPVASIPADNWSARWTSVQTLSAGTYQINVAADDGVRVTIDGVTYISEFHGATGQTYRANVTLGAGQHSFLIEFYEASGVAFLNYTFGPAVSTSPTLVPTPNCVGCATATVTGAFRLNVRNAPSAINTQVLTKINRNETYAIVGRNARGTWYQINVNGIVGWVNARYVTANNATNVPVTDGSSTTTCSGAPTPRLVVGRTGRVLPGLPNNIRQQPSATSTRLGQIPPGGIFTVLSAPTCASGYYWWQVNYNGIIGYTPEGANGEYFLEPAS